MINRPIPARARAVAWKLPNAPQPTMAAHDCEKALLALFLNSWKENLTRVALLLEGRHAILRYHDFGAPADSALQSFDFGRGCHNGGGHGAIASAVRGKDHRVHRIEPRQQPLDGEELRSILPLKIRAPLRMEDVRETITRLWATLAYTDIQIDAEPAGEQVLIRILTENRWFVGRVAAGGS